jgi:hypothetical protein
VVGEAFLWTRRLPPAVPWPSSQAGLDRPSPTAAPWPARPRRPGRHRDPDLPDPDRTVFLALLAQSPNPGYGPFVMDTSVHSNSITDWEQSGDALIAIHGPLGADTAIGTTGAAISHGCIRLHLADLPQLRQVPAGTPITIASNLARRQQTPARPAPSEVSVADSSEYAGKFTTDGSSVDDVHGRGCPRRSMPIVGQPCPRPPAGGRYSACRPAEARQAGRAMPIISPRWRGLQV